tara:strand:+ start:227 stop:592 length:366 start_codon:yes stop_codon:yes gene_type:complete
MITVIAGDCADYTVPPQLVREIPVLRHMCDDILGSGLEDEDDGGELRLENVPRAVYEWMERVHAAVPGSLHTVEVMPLPAAAQALCDAPPLPAEQLLEVLEYLGQPKAHSVLIHSILYSMA